MQLDDILVKNDTDQNSSAVMNSKSTVGTLGEKTLHAYLKHYFEPDITKHEIKVGAFVADIVSDEGIIEIQTRSFDKLRKKLTEFLGICPVTVVYPLPKTKWLLWIDENTGETTKKRKSPKQGSIYDAFHELYKIKPFLKHSNFRLCIILINMEEYRYLNGWSEDRKRGSTRYNRIPLEVVEETYFCKMSDYLQFIPDILGESFTSKDYKSATSINLRGSQTGLNILHDIGVVTRIGKQGNLYIYKRTEHDLTAGG